MLAGSLVSPNEATPVQAIKASGMVGATLDGRHAHALARRRGLDTSATVIANALVDMYGRWGCVEEAQGVFDRIPQRDVVSWTALIHAYGHHNRGREALERFLDMQRHGVRPNGSTFTAVLVACSHAGLVDAGAACLRSMAAEHGLVPAPEHVTSVADMLARAGRLDDAEAVLLGADGGGVDGGTVNRVGWMALLSACRAHGGQVDLARRCFDRLLALGRADQEEDAISTGRRAPKASGYVVMAKVYAEAGMQREAAAVVAARRAAGARKKPARATVEVGTMVWEFVVGGARPDTSAKLANLNLRATEALLPLAAWAEEAAAAAAVPAADEAAAQEEEAEQEAGLCAHAEKLALAFGLLYTPPGAPLLINKNLRMCGHCHSGTKMVSRLEKRQITVRDAHRVHHFVDGVCSCGDRF